MRSTRRPVLKHSSIAACCAGTDAQGWSATGRGMRGEVHARHRGSLICAKLFSVPFTAVASHSLVLSLVPADR